MYIKKDMYEDVTDSVQVYVCKCVTCICLYTEHNWVYAHADTIQTFAVAGGTCFMNTVNENTMGYTLLSHNIMTTNRKNKQHCPKKLSNLI